MFWNRKKKEQKQQKDRQKPQRQSGAAQAPQAGAEEQGEMAQKSYQERLAFFRKAFTNVDPIRFRELEVGGVSACIVFFDGMVDHALLDNHVIRPLLTLEALPKGPGTADELAQQVAQIGAVKKTENTAEILDAIAYGQALLLVDGVEEMILFNVHSMQLRAITEPEGEKVLSGPREGFTENMLQNISQVRRKLRTHKLKIQYRQMGEQTKTSISILYIEGLVDLKVLKTLHKRLEQISIDGVLDANYLSELIRDFRWSPFSTTGYTERPDVVVAKLLEGRVAIMVDGTPVALTIPYLLIESFQSNEDYYLNFYFTTATRLLRMLGTLLAMMVPAFYIAVMAYHQEMLPAPLLISVATERQSVPLPAALEAFVMLGTFEILRETAVRLQTNVGQALSIVGALVVGQAAVEAKLVAAPMIIVVAISGITSLLVPRMNTPVLYIRFGLLFLASCFGFLGVAVGFAITLTHLLKLRSFGVWHVAGQQGLHFQNIKDTFIRVPWYQMILRPQQLVGRNYTRQQWEEEDEQ